MSNQEIYEMYNDMKDIQSELPPPLPHKSEFKPPLPEKSEEQVKKMRRSTVCLMNHSMDISVEFEDKYDFKPRSAMTI